MKIIIDIPRAKYNTLRNDSTDYRGNIGVIYRAIQNGIVLPENHGDLPSVTPKPKTGKWILVSERLPENKGEYLVSGKNKMWICEFLDMGIIKGWANNAKNPCVEAWMPLPEPYRAEGSENEK